MLAEDSDSGDFRRKLTTPFYLPSSDPRSEEGDFASYSYRRDGDNKVKGEKRAVQDVYGQWQRDDSFQQQQDPLQQHPDPPQQHHQQWYPFPQDPYQQHQQHQDPFLQYQHAHFNARPQPDHPPFEFRDYQWLRDASVRGQPLFNLVGPPAINCPGVSGAGGVSLPLWRRASLPNRAVGRWESHNIPTTPPLPPLPPSVLNCPSDLGGADAIRLPPSRMSDSDPVGDPSGLGDMPRGGIRHDVDPDFNFGYEDFDQFPDALPVSSRDSHHDRNTYRQDPNESVGWEDEYVVPVAKVAKQGKVAKTRPRKTPGRQAGDQNERPRPVIDHDEQVQRLVGCMPHLKQLQTYSSRAPSSGSITRLEYGKDVKSPRQKSRETFDSRSWTGNASKTLAEKLAPNGNKPCCLRVLLVVDLSRDLMRALGSQYKVDPGAFAAHISLSGHNQLSYTDLPESRWSTAKTKKSYRSIKWFRPVRLGSRVLSWLQNPEDLIKLEGRGIEWTETSYERPLGRGNILVETKTKHHVKLNTNTFRQTRPLSTRPLDFSKDSVPAVWEERATVFLSTEKRPHTMIVLLDPLPSLVDSKVVEELEYSSGYRMWPDLPTSPRTKVTEMIPAFAPLALAPRTPIKFDIPNKLEATENEIRDFEALINASSSTSADMESWILQDKNQTPAGSKDPMLTLLRIAYFDTVHYLDNLEWTLDEITKDSLDEFTMTRRLPAWRKLLNELEIEIPALGHSLGRFMAPDHAAHRKAETILHDLQHERIPDFLKRVRAVHAALRSEMSLLDSSRSITEARTMSRLTELAFVFIPLTFASSLFSMQVVELEAGISLWIFVLTALGLGVLTYATRDLLQSDILQVLDRRARKSALASGRNSTAAQGASAAQILKYVALSMWRGGEAGNRSRSKGANLSLYEKSALAMARFRAKLSPPNATSSDPVSSPGIV